MRRVLSAGLLVTMDSLVVWMIDHALTLQEKQRDSMQNCAASSLSRRLSLQAEAIHLQVMPTLALL